MQKEQKKAVDKLNDLVQICNDGRKGYLDAAENVEDGNLKTIFRSAGQQRTELAAQLQNEITKLGGAPAHEGDTQGVLHRIWMDVRSAFAGNDNEAVLKEVERGEETAVEHYSEAIDTLEVPEYLKDTLRQQQSKIQQTLNEVRKIKSTVAS
ncbi:MAG: PA2169 family four-helix-bundle protein [Bacteroidia bacterium]